MNIVKMIAFLFSDCCILVGMFENVVFIREDFSEC